MSVVEGRREWLFLRVLLAAAVILGVILLQAGAREALAKNPETIMRANCSTCHGKKGEGGKSWVTGKPAPKIAGQLQSYIELKIREGVAPHMPAFPVREISEVEKQNLAYYIATLPASYIPEPAYQYTVTITDENPWYTPGQLRVEAGETVRWVNKGKTYHPVTQADSAATMQVGELVYGVITDSGLLGPNGVFYRTFNNGDETILYPAMVVAAANNLGVGAGDAVTEPLENYWANPNWEDAGCHDGTVDQAVTIPLQVYSSCGLRPTLETIRGGMTFLCKVHPYMQGEIWVGKAPPLTGGSATPTSISSSDKPSVYSGVYGVGEVWYGAQFLNMPLRAKDGAIQVIDAETWTVKSIIPVGNNPHNIWFSQGGRYALETSWFDNYVSIIDAKNKRILKEMPSGVATAHVTSNDSAPQAQINSPYDNTKMYLSIQASNYIQEVLNTDQDPSNWTLGSRSPTSGTGVGDFGPHGIWFGGGGNAGNAGWVVTANTQNDSMSIFDAANNLEATIITGGQVNKDALRAVFGINTDLGSIPLGAGITHSTQPVTVAGTKYDVAVIGNCLDASVTIARKVYDSPSGWAKVGDVSVGTFPLKPCGIQTPISPDGKYIFSIASGGVMVLDIAEAATPGNYSGTPPVCGGIGTACANAIVKATFTGTGFGKGTHGAAFGPKRGGGYFAYVTHKFDNHMTVIDVGEYGVTDPSLAGHVPLQTTTTVNTTTKENMALYFNKYVPGTTGGNGIAVRVDSDSPNAVKPKTQSRSGQVDVMFESTGFSHYRVYRHARTDSYNANFDQICEVDYNNSTGTITSSTCASSQITAAVVQPDINSSRYIVVRDQSVENWNEYYYLVTEGPDYVEYNGDPADYFVVAAFPPNQTRHGSYTEFTGVCTNCHGLHSAPSSQKLLKGDTVTDLCATCHDGSVSKYDAARGRVFMGRLDPGPSDRYALAPAGPFGTQFVTGIGGDGGYGSASSVHNVFRAGSTTGAYVYMAPGTGFRSMPTTGDNLGSGNDFSPVGWTNQLSCISCHEPHNRPFNFRLLRNDINDRASGAGSHGGALVVRGVSETGTAVYDTTGAQKWPAAYGDWGAVVSNEVYVAQTKFFTGTAKFCSQCHRAFYNESVRVADRRELEKMFSFHSEMTAEQKRHTIAFFGALATLDYDATIATAQAVYGATPMVVSMMCSECHSIIYEAFDGDWTIATSVYGRPVRLGWTTGNRALDTASGASMAGLDDSPGAVLSSGHRHPTQVPAYRVTFTGKVVEGALDDAGYSAGGQFQERVRPGPVHVGVPLEGLKDGMSSYVENDVVCLTCHLSHGSRARVNDSADWAEWFTGDQSVGVAYANWGMNGTTVNSIVYGNYYYNDAPSQYPAATPPAGPSTVLARFTPEASVCYRCHSTK